MLFMKKLFIFWLLLSAATILQARPVSVLSIQTIADKADVVVVGKVTAIQPAAPTLQTKNVGVFHFFR